MSEFPLAGMVREVAERNQIFAEELLEAAVKDLRAVLAGEPRSGLFQADSDPVDNVVQHARQAEQGRVVIEMDDQARSAQSAKGDGAS